MRGMKIVVFGFKGFVSLSDLRNIMCAGLLAVLFLTCGADLRAEDKGKEDAWRFTLTPYVWLPSVSGSMKFDFPGGSGKTDISSSDYMENLQIAGMLSLETAKGRWSILSDILYVDFSDSDRGASLAGLGIGGGLQVSGDTGLEAFIFQIGGAYSVYKSQDANFDVLLGMRYAEIDGKADLDIVGPLNNRLHSWRFTASESFFDPIIGFRGKFSFAKNWFVPYHFDIGGFSVDSDLTIQAYAAIGYRFTDWFSMSLGYRYLYYDFGNTKLVRDITLNGGILGFAFNF